MESRKPVEIIIHIDENLDDEHRQRLVESLSKDKGITRAAINPEKNHLLVVDYQPDLINSQQVLQQVKAKGFEAELVGGI